MRLLELYLKNIGPFDEAHLKFVSEPEEPAPATLITGQNGTGKTIIIDAIRGIFGEYYCHLERGILRPGFPYLVDAFFRTDHKLLISSSLPQGNGFSSAFTEDDPVWSGRPIFIEQGTVPCPHWVVDYWRSPLATDSYGIKNLIAQDHRKFLQGALQGIYRNAEVTELICYFDYLRDSRDPREKEAGELAWNTLSKIVNASLLDGELSHVARASFTPIVRQAGQLVSLAQLSSGNAYLIQRMVSLLGKMYAVHVLRQTPPEELCQTPGLLLIDEAENHLHPLWQKRFIPNVLSVFPNLQIIATTHSPFIISSVPHARIYVCRYDGKRCVVEEAPAGYANKPVDEILASDVFNETLPFNEEISNLMEERKRAVAAGDETLRRDIERQLLEKNPEYFSYLRIEEHLRALDKPEAR